jgi:hypothetical protein
LPWRRRPPSDFGRPDKLNHRREVRVHGVWDGPDLVIAGEASDVSIRYLNEWQASGVNALGSLVRFSERAARQQLNLGRRLPQKLFEYG